MPKINRKEKLFKIICPQCLEGRFVTYAQKWNINAENSSGKCRKCTTPLNGFKNRFEQDNVPHNKGLVGFGKWFKTAMFCDDNPAWKGDVCSHEAHHQWIYRRLGKAEKCKYCGFEGKCSWANLKKHEYHKDINDYISLCFSCHKKYDLGKLKL